MSQDTQTSEQMHDTGPLGTPPVPPDQIDNAPTATAESGSWRPIIGLGLLGIVLVIGIVLVLNVFNNPANDQRPIDVVQGFATAIEAKDVTEMLSYIEPTVLRRQIGPELRSYVEYIEQISFTDTNYEILENDGERAVVRLTGTLEYQLRDRGSGSNDLDQTFELVNIEGSWYIRSVTLPQT
ncbi:MAG: hypothetical protein AAGF95_26730 [Chloroflexota bacterium]